MVKNVEIYPLLSGEPLPEKRQLEIARDVQRFVYEDTLRVGATEEEARSVADPDGEDAVKKQLQRLLHPAAKGTRYLGVYADEEQAGVIKLGPHLRGDAAPFREKPTMLQRIRARLADEQRPAELTPQGLHVFAVRPGLAEAALTKVYFDFVLPSQELKAAVHENDAELRDALTVLGAPEDGPVGRKRIGNYIANYVLRTLPPRE